MCQVKFEHKNIFDRLFFFLILRLCKTSHTSCDVTRVCMDIIAKGFSHRAACLVFFLAEPENGVVWIS